MDGDLLAHPGIPGRVVYEGDPAYSEMMSSTSRTSFEEQDGSLS